MGRGGKPSGPFAVLSEIDGVCSIAQCSTDRIGRLWETTLE